MAHVIRKLQHYFPWGPNEMVWPDMLPEVRGLMRAWMNPRAAALLALTCKAEAVIGGAAAKEYLVKLAYMPKQEYSQLLGYFRERVRTLNERGLGLLNHAIVEARDVADPVDCDIATSLLMLALRPGTTVHVCRECDWWSQNHDLPLIHALNFPGCAANIDHPCCHAERDCQCSIPGCSNTGCAEHMNRLSCDSALKCSEHLFVCGSCAVDNEIADICNLFGWRKCHNCAAGALRCLDCDLTGVGCRYCTNDVS